MNEPIAHYFEDKEELNAELQPLMIRTAKAIREVDSRHILILAGAQWNTNFKVYDDWTFDDNLIFTCHIYKCPPSGQFAQRLRGFPRQVAMPDVYGRNRREYRRVGREFPQGARRDEHRVDFLDLQAARCPAVVRERADARRLAQICDFLAADRSEYGFIREARPDQSEMRRVLVFTSRIANLRTPSE